jgi:hypothetical protein
VSTALAQHLDVSLLCWRCTTGRLYGKSMVGRQPAGKAPQCRHIARGVTLLWCLLMI